jgi:hypothetical protein
MKFARTGDAMEMILLPYASFGQTAGCLDDQTLSEQIAQARKILLTLLFPPRTAEPNTRAINMWQNYEKHLCTHGIALCIQRQIRHEFEDDTMLDWFRSHLMILQDRPTVDPPWLGDYRLHKSHRARLLAIDPDYYGQFGWSDSPQDDTRNCWWPTE